MNKQHIDDQSVVTYLMLLNKVLSDTVPDIPPAIVKLKQQLTHGTYFTYSAYFTYSKSCWFLKNICKTPWVWLEPGRLHSTRVSDFQKDYADTSRQSTLWSFIVVFKRLTHVFLWTEYQLLEEDLDEESSTEEEEEDLMVEETDLTPVEDSDLPQIMAAVIIQHFLSY